MKLLVPFLVAALAATVAGTPPVRGSGDRRPSFLVVRADELRASALSCYGDPYATTPNLDCLAADGVRYDRALAAEPVCSAHRTSFDTGYFTFANRNLNKLHPDDETIHDVLHDEGYRTWHVGKWHKTPIYLMPLVPAEMVPKGILDGLDYHGGHERAHEVVNSVYFENGIAVAQPAGPWRPQTHVDLAIAQIDIAVAAGKPFYGIVDLEPPHYPYDVVVGTQWDIYSPGDIPAPPNVPASIRSKVETNLAYYYSMTYSVDDMLGQLLEHLDRVGIASSTVVIFTADHGAHLGAHGHVEKNAQKRSPYEEAIRVPLLIRDPEGPRGAVSSEFVSPVDFKLMILRRARAPLDPAMHAFRHLPEGRLLVQVSSQNTPDGAWYGFLRRDGMKYARSENSGPWVLFDTEADPFELNNLIGTGDPREAEMQVLLDRAAAAMGLTIPF